MSTVLNLLRVDKSVPVPLYYQLKTQILELINNGFLKEGDLLPSEIELCAQLNVSRPTIRQCFGELVNEGVLTRQKAKGTYIAPKKIDTRFLNKLHSFDEEMRELGLAPYKKILKCSKIEGEPTVCEALGLTDHSPLIYLLRLRGANNEPFAIQESYLSFKKYPELLNVDFAKESLYDSLQKEYGTRIEYAHRSITAQNATKQDATLLGIEPQSAICVVTTIAYNNKHQAVEYTVTRYRADRMSFSVELYR